MALTALGTILRGCHYARLLALLRCNASQLRTSRSHRCLHVRPPRPASPWRRPFAKLDDDDDDGPRGAHAQPASGSWLSRAEHRCSFAASVRLNQHPYDSIQPPGIFFIPTTFQSVPMLETQGEINRINNLLLLPLTHSPTLTLLTRTRSLTHSPTFRSPIHPLTPHSPAHTAIPSSPRSSHNGVPITPSPPGPCGLCKRPVSPASSTQHPAPPPPTPPS